MDDTPRVVDLGDAPPGTSIETSWSVLHLLETAERAPTRADLVVPLEDRLLAYGRRVEGSRDDEDVAVPTAIPPRAQPDLSLTSNAFAPFHESDACFAAAFSIAAGRTLTTGPESERLLVVLRGTGLVFLQNDESMHVYPGAVAVLPAGEPARVWSRGPEEDLLGLVFQPRSDAPVGRRTLASEIRRRRGESGGEEAASPDKDA